MFINCGHHTEYAIDQFLSFCNASCNTGSKKLRYDKYIYIEHLEKNCRLYQSQYKSLKQYFVCTLQGIWQPVKISLLYSFSIFICEMLPKEIILIWFHCSCECLSLIFQKSCKLFSQLHKKVDYNTENKRK